MHIPPEDHRKAIEALPEGDQLIAYLTQQFGWEFRKCINQELPVPNEASSAVLTAYPKFKTLADTLASQYRDRMIVIDSFAEHGERRAFITEVMGEKGEWLNHISKLRTNNCEIVPQAIEVILMKLSKSGIAISFNIQAMREATKIEKNYSQLTLEEKIAYTKVIDEQIFAFFDALSKATQVA